MLDDHIWASQSPDAFGGLARTNVTSHDQLVLRVIANREGYRPHEPRKPLSRRSPKVSTVAASCDDHLIHCSRC